MKRIEQTLRQERRSRYTCKRLALVLGVALAALLGSFHAQARSAVTPDRVAILVVSDASKAPMEQLVNALINRLHERKKVAHYTDEQLPVLLYHLDNRVERDYCTKKLGVRPADLPFVGVVILRGKEQPERPIYRLECVTNVEEATSKVMARAAEAFQVSTLSTKKRTWVGFQMVDLKPEKIAELHLPARVHVQVLHVMARSPAEKAGIQAGDCLMDMDGQPVLSGKAFAASVKTAPANRRIQLKIFRRGTGILQKTVIVEPLPQL